MKDYKFLVASDMDHTLILPDQPVSQANKDAIRAIREAGGCLTLATGRTFYHTGSYIKDLEIEVPIITSNGAAISDPKKFKDISSFDFPPGILKKLIRLFGDNNINATGYSSDGIYFFPKSSRRIDIEAYNLTAPENFKAVIIDDLDHSFNKFLLIDPPSDLVDKIREIEGLQVVRSARKFYDVMMEGPSKGSAMRAISRDLNIDLTFGIGDSENDLPLLKSADHAVAMAGSDPVLLQIADFITSDCKSDGFARAVYDYILPTVAKSCG